MRQVGFLFAVLATAVLVAAPTMGCASAAPPPSEDTQAPEVGSEKGSKKPKSPVPAESDSTTTPAETPAPSTPPATPLPGTPPPVPEVPPFFALRVNEECLDVPEGNHADGVELITWKCQGTDNQLFSVGPATTLRSSSGKCVDVPGGAATDGAKVILWPCNSGANQRIERIGGTLQVLGKCLTAQSGKVLLMQCNGSLEQNWRMQ